MAAIVVMNEMARVATFSARLRSGERLLGTFVKTPHPAVVEVLGLSDLDCVCLDASTHPSIAGRSMCAYWRRELRICRLWCASRAPILRRFSARSI